MGYRTEKQLPREKTKIMNFLDFIPESIFEIIGSLTGFASCFVITIQIRKEYRSQTLSSLSSSYTIGWGIIYFFWGLYGIRFNAIAIWLTNGIAVVLQLILYIVTRRKMTNKNLIEKNNFYE